MIEILKFYSKTCGPCKVMGNILNEITNIIVEDIDIENEDNVSLINKYKIRTIPTILITNNGEIIKEFKGVIPKDEFLRKIMEIKKAYDVLD